MLYEFKESDAWDFQRFVGIPAKQRGEELQFHICPYCKGGGSKDAGTFSINLRTGQFKCMRASCSVSGNMITLSKDFGFSLGTMMDTYNNQRRKNFRTFKKPAAPIQPKPAALEYLKNRGISAVTAARYQITVRNDKPDVLVFPFLDESGQMQLVKYRRTKYDLERDKGKEWAEANCKPILFGMYQCNTENKTLVLTEGQIDSLSVAESGIENAVSVPTGKNGFTWFPHCWEWLQKFDMLVVFGDCERGEITLLEDMRRRFPGVVKAVRQQDYKGCKDANEILQKYGAEAVRQAVQQAEIVPVRQVKELADVKSIDLFSLPKIPTGIKSLDMVLSGGLYLGQVMILSGKRGGGKSTLGSQILANALETGKIVFAYSGELPDYHFKRWLDLQIAGRGNIIDRSYDDGTTSYYLTNSTSDAISEWYRGRAFLFDNQAAEDEELADLLQTIEKAVQQYGIQLVLLDNLMTALDVGMDVDLYRAQSKFVDKLVKMAKRLCIAIILVAHPRKNQFGRDDTDEIAGSGDITNKVDIVATYKRGRELPDTERLLSVSKNRLTGKLAVGEQEIHLFYDPVSKRISDNKDDFDKRYGWIRSEDGFVSADDEPTPFE